MNGRDAHRQLTTVFSVALVLIGVAMIVRTISAGGGPAAIGIIMGVLFVLAGAGRLWVARSTR